MKIDFDFWFEEQYNREWSPSDVTTTADGLIPKAMYNEYMLDRYSEMVGRYQAELQSLRSERNRCTCNRV